MMVINRLPFLFAIATVALLGASVFLSSPGEGFNKELLMIAFYFAAAYWLLTVIMVATARKLKSPQRKAWLIILISIPFVGGLLYQLTQMQSKKNSHRHHSIVKDNNLSLSGQSLN